LDDVLVAGCQNQIVHLGPLHVTLLYHATSTRGRAAMGSGEPVWSGQNRRDVPRDSEAPRGIVDLRAGGRAVGPSLWRSRVHFQEGQKRVPYNQENSRSNNYSNGFIRFQNAPRSAYRRLH
jgi:hypothetical protein